MLKKRIIFTLLYDNGQFMLSRNFRLQRVGDLHWLQTNYNFSKISFSIDELIVLDVTRGKRNISKFCDTLKYLTEGCFVPIAAGGGIRKVEHARVLLRSGADKVVINTPAYENPNFVRKLTSEFGQQCLIAAMDIQRGKDGIYRVWVDSGSRCLDGTASEQLEMINRSPVGEIYLNSIDRDGTGQGYDFELLELLPDEISIPVILAGGVGNAKHLAAGIRDSRVDAVATAHLFNFVGDGLRQARRSLIAEGADLPVWDLDLLNEIEIQNLGPFY